MRFAETALAAALLLATPACHSPKSDFENLCHATEHAGVTPDDDPATKAVKISKWISQNIKGSEATELMRALPNVDPKQKGALLTQTAAKYGVSPCPLATDTWGAQ